MIIPGLIVCKIKEVYNFHTWEDAVNFYCNIKHHFDAWKVCTFAKCKVISKNQFS